MYRYTPDIEWTFEWCYVSHELARRGTFGVNQLYATINDFKPLIDTVYIAFTDHK